MAVIALTARPDRYRWAVLSNTTAGMLVATVNSSIVLISLPAIFRGIGLDPLLPNNVGYLLWTLMGYTVVTAVMVVGLGRIGDLHGRVRLYNLGFAVFTAGSIGLSLVLWRGPSAALALIGLRVVQGIGAAMIMANAAAIVTDAFPPHERAMALGLNSVAGIAGSFVGLVLGGLLATGNWHLVFLVSVPVGLVATCWSFCGLREVGAVRRARIDWLGNLTFAFGLVLPLVGITYGIQPYGGAGMGWTNPAVVASVAGGLALLAAFVMVERRVAEPMFQLRLFALPGFTAGSIAGLLASMGRCGLMLVLIVWLQGIWLPLHRYGHEVAPLWAAVYLLPMTAGFLIAGPASGALSDRLGVRPFTIGGMLAAAATFALMLLLPADFPYPPFAALLLCNGLAMGLFSAPNTAAVMTAVPADQRGAASGMLSTFQNAGQNLSIGLFFSLTVAGLGAHLPAALLRGLTAQGVPAPAAARIARLPPVDSLLAAFLGDNPVRQLLARLPPDRAAHLTGETFFPRLIAGPFLEGVHVALAVAGAMMLVAAAASWPRSGPLRPPEPVDDGAPAPASAEEEAGARPVVVISAAHGAGGTLVGRQLASRLGVPLVDRGLDAATARRLQAPLADATSARAGDSGDGVVRLLAEATRCCPPVFGTNTPAEVGDGHRDDAHRAAGKLARSLGCVMVGDRALGALHAAPRVLRIRLDGPVERRIRRVMRAEGIDESVARSDLQAIDRGSQAYLRRIYGLDPADPRLYHLVIDSTALPAETCVRLALEVLEAL